ncbi:hypothetical protein ABE61_22205 [Lysinibacillus sphaericus]|uniref:hypothetical protein n=1 Tax=Lysinibacillus sphaericus TaxID=1421 RepID=UPI0018CCCC39|nr:hypothetical protein [Lysinibacillus sphaericus]MBG9456644.1 hypothetical protein [Lysinibacillus sphaericus]MBG9480043.1 hypothetical protein [Lysinibacillus sphaericus]MBG9594255.1 hypothetical protein [Lysinibacillus sphaericus]
MDRIFSLCLSSCYLLFSQPSDAYIKDSPSSYEEVYPEIGYKTVEGAASDFERHFHQGLKLPLRVPPISFTHHFGRFNDLDGDMNDFFEVTFVNNQLPEHHYKITVRPIQYKFPVKKESIVKTFILKKGTTSIYMEISGFHVLAFERENWQYMLWIDKRVSNKVTPEVLVDIANSIDYTTLEDERG